MKKTTNLILSVLLLAIPLMPAFATERRPNLSYAEQKLHIIPELALKDMEPYEQIIFLHIPKTAGTNLDTIAKAVSKEKGNFHYQRFPVPRVAGRSPILITPDWIGGLKQLESNSVTVHRIPRPFFVTGHFPYGLHQHFPNPSKYITLIRHPLERELSSANFDWQRAYIDAEDFENYLFEQMIDNPQVRMIAGLGYMRGPCTEKTFEKAKENIERDFLLAAPSDDVDSFIQILASTQKWGAIAYAPMQITHQKVIDKLNPQFTQILLQKHNWDVKLYEWTKARWEVRKKQVIVSTKHLEPDDTVLTLLPDYLTTRQAVLLTAAEVDAYNQTHQDNNLVENNQ